MNDLQMGTVESRFADIIWQNEPISSAGLAKKSEELLKWKKSTTYTVLRRLCDKGIFKNEKGTVSSIISREKYYSLQSANFVDEAFDGSLPAFIAAFISHKELTAKEAEEIQRMIDDFRKEGGE